MKVRVKDIQPAPEINSRGQSSEALISRYTEALTSGDEVLFPPILIQRVAGYGNSDEPITIIVDGIHRWNAYQALKRDEIEATEWRPGETLNFQEWRPAMLLESAVRNSQHGEPLSTKQKKVVAESIAEGDPKETIKQAELAAKLAVAQKTISNWIADIRTRQRGGRDSTIHKLARLGWTQEAIAQVVGVDQSIVSRTMQNSNFTEMHNLLAQGRDMAYIAQHYRIPQVLAWALRLEAHTDMERFKAMEWGLRTWDLWNFNDCDDRFGEDWPGRIPAQLVAHTLYFFTNPGDWVLDPMAGGGVTPDTCLVFGRKCRAYDIAIREQRPEIEYHAWLQGAMTWPNAPKADLVFFDPPYYTKMAQDYTDKAPDGVTPISSLSRQEYLDFFSEFFSLAKENTAPNGRIAFLNADWRDYQSKAALEESPENDVTMFDYHRLLSEAGWTVTHRIECPMSTERMRASTVAAMQANRTIGVVSRTLLIAKKG